MDGKFGIRSIIINLLADEWIKPPEGVPCEESRRWKQFGVSNKKNHVGLHQVAHNRSRHRQHAPGYRDRWPSTAPQKTSRGSEASSRDSQVPSHWILSLCKYIPHNKKHPVYFHMNLVLHTYQGLNLFPCRIMGTANELSTKIESLHVTKPLNELSTSVSSVNDQIISILTCQLSIYISTINKILVRTCYLSQ